MPSFQVNSSFSRGEIDDTLLDRQDEGFYATAARRMENWFPDIGGSAFIRPAFQNLTGEPNALVFAGENLTFATGTLRTFEFAGEQVLIPIKVWQNDNPAGVSLITVDVLLFLGGQLIPMTTRINRLVLLPGDDLATPAFKDPAAYFSTAQFGPTFLICCPMFGPLRIFRTGSNAYSFNLNPPLYQELVGAVTPTKGGSVWTGTSGMGAEFAATIFQDQLAPGDIILFRGDEFEVATVTSQVSFTTTTTYPGDSVLDTVAKQAAPPSSEFPLFRPALVATFAGRVVYANTRDKPTGIFASSASNPFIITPGSVRDDAPINAEFLADGLDRIEWMVGSSQLFIGSGQGEYVSGPGQGQYTPANATIQKVGSTGSSGVPVILTQDVLYFLNRLGTQLNAVQFDFDTQAFATQDISYFAPHLLRNQIAGMTYRPATGYDRTPRMFFVDRQGVLRAMAIAPANKLVAWSRVVLPSDPFEGNFGVISPQFVFKAIGASKTRVFGLVTTPFSSSNYLIVLDESPAADFLLDLSQFYGPAPVSKLVSLFGVHAEIIPAYTGGFYVVSSTAGGLGVVLPDSLGRLDLSSFAGDLGTLTVGLPYPSQIRMLPAVISDEGTGPRTNRARRVVRVLVDVINSTNLFVNGAPILGVLPAPTGVALPVKSGPFGTRLLGWRKQDSIVVSSNGALPATIASISRECS